MCCNCQQLHNRKGCYFKYITTVEWHILYVELTSIITKCYIIIKIYIDKKVLDRQILPNDNLRYWQNKATRYRLLPTVSTTQYDKKVLEDHSWKQRAKNFRLGLHIARSLFSWHGFVSRWAKSFYPSGFGPEFSENLLDEITDHPKASCYCWRIKATNW